MVDDGPLVTILGALFLLGLLITMMALTIAYYGAIAAAILWLLKQFGVIGLAL